MLKFSLIKNTTIQLIVLIGLLFFIESCKTRTASLEYASNSVLKTINSKAEKNILVCAHRSYHNNAPENSLSSISKAIDAKIDIVEIDVRTTKDSILILMHDGDLDRTSTGKGKIKNYTYEQLQNFFLKFEDSVTTEKIPLLSDALKLAKGKIILNLDLKAVNYHQIHKMLESFQMQHEVISFIGKKTDIQEMFSIDPYYAILPLSNTLEDVIFFINNDNSPLQHFTDKSFTDDLMKIARKNKQLVFVNTLWKEDNDFIKGDTKSMDKVINLKPAIIQTDYPKQLIEYLKTKNLHQ